MLIRRHNSTCGRKTRPIGEGVNFIGYLHHASGLGSAARGNYRVVQASGLSNLPFAFPGIDGVIGNPYTINFHHWHPEDDIMRRIDLNQVNVFHGRHNIGFWVTEVTGVSDIWMRNSERFDEVWTASRFCQRIFERNGIPCPVKVLPHALTYDRPVSYRLRQNHLPGFRFLCVYDSHSRISRKNPVAAIEAFRRAFSGEEPVRLTVKIRNAARGESELLRLVSQEDERVEIVAKEYTAYEMEHLMATSNALVSLHRSEGFGLHVAEAMAAGLVPIISGCGGCLEFATRERAHWVATTEAPVADCYFLEHGGTWWEPDIGHAAFLMRHVWEQYGDATTAQMLEAGQAVRKELHVSTICETFRRLVTDTP